MGRQMLGFKVPESLLEKNALELKVIIGDDQWLYFTLESGPIFYPPILGQVGCLLSGLIQRCARVSLILAEKGGGFVPSYGRRPHTLFGIGVPSRSFEMR
jgi:hypothetical protein